MHRSVSASFGASDATSCSCLTVTMKRCERTADTGSTNQIELQILILRLHSILDSAECKLGKFSEADNNNGWRYVTGAVFRSDIQ